MTDMPDEIYVWQEFFDGYGEELTALRFNKQCDDDGTKYIRSDIHEAELTKLRNALDVAERALENINDICGTVNFSSHNQMREAIEGAVELSDEALTAIKQARGE